MSVSIYDWRMQHGEHGPAAMIESTDNETGDFLILLKCPCGAMLVMDEGHKESRDAQASQM